MPDLVTLDPLFWLVAVIAIACLGLSKAGFLGFGLIATPLLALKAPPVQAAAILLPVMLAQDYFSGWSYRRDWDRSVLKVTIPGAVLGIGLAWALAAHVSDAWLRIAVGVLALAFMLRQLVARHAEASAPRRGLGVICGVTSGFAGTLANAGGPPLLIYVLPQQLAKMTFVGTLAFYFATLNTMKVVPFLALGQLTTASLVISALLLPLALAATALGIRLVRITPPATFHRVAHAMVLIIGLALIWQGVTALASN